MALKQLMIGKKLETLRTQLILLEQNDTDFSTRAAALEKREAELETAVQEVTEETPEADLGILEGSANELESAQKTLAEEESTNKAEKGRVGEEIKRLQAELDLLNQRSAPPDDQQDGKRKDEKYMETRGRFFGMNMEQRERFASREDVKEFLARVRGVAKENRAVTGGELGIPTVMTELLRDNLNRYSKLSGKVRMRTIRGKERQNIIGAIPEGIWTEMVDNLNELTVSFHQLELDGYKVGGYIAIPNSTLNDSDLMLAGEILDALGQAIGYALDKAIVYGKGTKMPLGFVTRLAQSIKPEGYPACARAWADLHISNVLTLNLAAKTGTDFFAELLTALAKAKPNYSGGDVIWIMNRKTHIDLTTRALAFNAAAALVSGINQSMPVIGGEVIELEFMGDNEIAGGYADLYALAEREGATIQPSEHVRFLQDQTVFKGTARYDGKPAIAEGFVIVSYDNTAPTTTANFTADTANP